MHEEKQLTQIAVWEWCVAICNKNINAIQAKPEKTAQDYLDLQKERGLRAKAQRNIDALVL